MGKPSRIFYQVSLFFLFRHIMFPSTVQMYMYSQPQEAFKLKEDFICIICDKSLSSKVYLEHHIRYIHATTFKETGYIYTKINLEPWYNMDVFETWIHRCIWNLDTSIYSERCYMDTFGTLCTDIFHTYIVIFGTLIHWYIWKGVVQWSQIQFSNPSIFATWWRKPLTFQTCTISPNLTQSLKYQRYMTSGCNDI